METAGAIVEQMFGLFYIRRPSASYLPPMDNPPNYIADGIPCLLVFVILEMVVRRVKGLGWPDVADATCSLSQGMMQETVRCTLRSVEGWAYLYVYQYWRLYDLPWDTPLSFCLTMLAVDFGYYWFHRASHEVNIVWASHQVHHSSEHYNLSTAFRQSFVQQYFQWIVYVPLAFLGVAPSMFFTHYQFNLLFQFWIHTEAIKSVGPLEHVLNTPSHHRVHHASNVKYLDKNYAGVLIIWDRMFGTFCWEEETPTYGLVHNNIESYNTWTIQTAHFRWVLSDIRQQIGWKNKLKRMVYGPGWVPGTERLGDDSTFPKPDPKRPKFDTMLPGWLKTYIFLHFLVVTVPSANFAQNHLLYPAPTCILYSLMLIYSLSCLGWLLDGARLATLAEMVRCCLCLASLTSLSWLPPVAIVAARLLLTTSLIMWLIRGSVSVFQRDKVAKSKSY